MIDVALESERGVPPSTTGAEMPTPTLAGPSRRSLDGADDHVDNYDAAPGETPEAAAGDERDDVPLMARASSSSGNGIGTGTGVGGGMVALELSSHGDGALGDAVLDDSQWRWRHTVSYWVCVCFILGSLLFVSGCAFWYKKYEYEARERALVTYPFLAGACCFTCGSYLGVFTAVNLGRNGKSVMWEWAPHKDGFLGYLCYLIGALVFNISCIEPLDAFSDLPSWMKREMAWGAAEVGSFFFILGAAVEVKRNGVSDVRAAIEDGTWMTLPFWVSWNNLFGGCFFFIAAVAGRFDPTSPGWVYTTYLIGSMNFFVASSLMMYMWKGEQYGLGFIPSINRLVPLRAASVADSALRAAGKGYRRVSKTHFAFLQMYIALTGASFIDFCFATQRFSVYSQYHGFAHFHEAVASLMGVFMAVGLLIMASVLHHTPRIHPFDKLLWWVNFYVFVKLIQILVSIFEYYTVALETEAKEAEETAANATRAPPAST